MMCWIVLGLPHNDNPLWDIWSSVACMSVGVLTPLLNCMLLESYRSAVKTRLPISAPFIEAVTVAATQSQVTLSATRSALTTMAGLDEELSVEEQNYTGEYRS